MTKQKKNIRERLNELAVIIESGNIPKWEEEWGGAGTIVAKELDPLYDAGRYNDIIVYTEHSLELSWLFYQLKDAFADEIDFGNKYEFYGNLADAGVEYNKTTEEKTLQGICKAVLDCAFMMDRGMYFAYGSNLNAKDWNRYHENSPLFDDVFEFVSNAVLPDYRLGFTRYAKSRAGGVLDIVESQGHGVPGAIFRVKSMDGWRALDAKEGAPTCYNEVSVTVVLENGEEYEVTTYQVCANRLQIVNDRENSYVKPHDDYVAVVSQGLKDCGLSDEHLDAALKT